MGSPLPNKRKGTQGIINTRNTLGKVDINLSWSKQSKFI